jgi:uncharacterized membrane protein
MRMKKALLIVSFVFSLFIFAIPSFAQQRVLPPEPPVEYFYKGTVEEVTNENETVVNGSKNFSQTLKVRVINKEKDKQQITIEHGGVLKDSQSQKLKRGDEIVVLHTPNSDSRPYYIVDKYRLDTMVIILAGFFLLVILIAGKKGLGSIIGMAFSVFIILQFIVPQILQGRDPLLISIVGSSLIMIITMFLAHGANKKTGIALVSTGISLICTGLLAYLFVSVTQLTGVGNEDAYMLQLGLSTINVKGLLLGGIIIGSLGVLDDITISQTATVFEIKRANKSLDFMEVVMRGYRVGKEHIASLVNTLVLAYAGASLSLFIFFVLNPSNQPYWVILNNEMIIEEVVRTLAGSIGLVLAVPITTILAAWLATKREDFK